MIIFVNVLVTRVIIFVKKHDHICDHICYKSDHICDKHAAENEIGWNVNFMIKGET